MQRYFGLAAEPPEQLFGNEKRMTNAAAPDRKIDAIELIRFIAALCVVFVHIPTVGAGHFGVDIFFVISGFVMMLSTEANTKNFFLKRLIRILPTYYLFTIGVFLIAVFFPTLLSNTTADLTHLIKSLLFVPFDKNGTGHAPILFLGWTLNYEMYFYLLFAVGLAVSKEYRGVVCAALLFFNFVLFHSCKDYPQAAYGDLIVFEFVFGIFLYLLMIKKSLTQASALFLVVFAATLIAENGLAHRLFYYGLPSLCFVWVVLYGFQEARLSSSVVTLGGASYALYLTHPYVIQFFDKVTGWFGGSAFQASVALVFSLMLANLVAILTYLLLEIPARRYLRFRLISS